MHIAVSEQLFDEQTAKFAGAILDMRKWQVLHRAYPVLDVLFEADGRRPLRVRFSCDDWNDSPPSVSLLEADGTGLAVVPTGSGIFNASSHPTTHLPFICMAGVREFHNHPSHTGDSWENYRGRGGYDLGGILTQIWQGWLKCNP